MASVMVLNRSNKSHAPKQLIRSLDRILDDAQKSGVLNLSGRTLKEFPKLRKEYNLTDTVNADFSKNRFSEVPPEVLQFFYLEKLDLYHNVLRILPDTISGLQSLVFLDLSRNQLQCLPPGLCQLAALQVLLLTNNRLTRLPADLSGMVNLAEMDLSANQLTLLPASVGRLSKLRSLVVRGNQLTSLPVELAALRLERLDVASNQISSLPIEFRVMTCLVDLELSHNPLVSPPSSLCARGKVHIFKFLEGVAQKGDARKVVRIVGDSHTLDGRGAKRRQTLPGRVNCRTPEPELFYGSSHRASQIPVANGSSGQSTPSTLSPSGTLDSATLEDMLAQVKPHLGEAAKRPDKLAGLVQPLDNRNYTARSESPPACFSPEPPAEEKKGPAEHIQTYREYKEALRLQRWQPQDIYRKGSETTPTAEKGECTLQRRNSESKTGNSADKKRDPKMEAVISYVKSQLPNGHGSPKTNGPLSPKSNGPLSPKSNGPLSPPKSYLPTAAKSNGSAPPPSEAKLVTASAGYINNNGGSTSPKKTVMRNGKEIGKLSPSRTLSFTMRREQDKAKEEALLIAQLKQSLESRLKVSLQVSELGAALQDGVVLCHLANHVRPRSVGSVHVPSPAVPKLTMAKCRRNVDNFLEACRRIGVPETLMCCSGDVLEGKGLVRVAVTTCELLKFHQPRQTHI